MEKNLYDNEKIIFTYVLATSHYFGVFADKVLYQHGQIFYFL